MTLLKLASEDIKTCQILPSPYIHVPMCIGTCMSIHVHGHIHTLRVRAHACNPYTTMCTCTHMYIPVHAHVQVCVHIYIQTHTRMPLHTCMHVCVSTHVHTFPHARTCMPLCMCTHAICSQLHNEYATIDTHTPCLCTHSAHIHIRVSGIYARSFAPSISLRASVTHSLSLPCSTHCINTYIYLFTLLLMVLGDYQDFGKYGARMISESTPTNG